MLLPENSDMPPSGLRTFAFEAAQRAAIASRRGQLRKLGLTRLLESVKIRGIRGVFVFSLFRGAVARHKRHGFHKFSRIHNAEPAFFRVCGQKRVANWPGDLNPG